MRKVLAATAVAMFALILVAAFWDQERHLPRDDFAVPEFTQMVKDDRVLDALVEDLSRLTSQYRKANGEVGFYKVEPATRRELNLLMMDLLNRNVAVNVGGPGRTGSAPSARAGFTPRPHEEPNPS